MSNQHFVSDLHLGHRKVADLRGFGEDTAAHDAWLAEQWDATVRPDDAVWVLGDLTLGPTAYALEWIRQRPGRKEFITGNHDEVHPMHRDAHKHQAEWMVVFASVQMAARRKIAGHNVLLSHFPYASDGDGEGRSKPFEGRYNQWRLSDDEDLPLIHGHTHSTVRAHGRMLHVGVDAWAGRPVPLSVVVDWLADLG